MLIYQFRINFAHNWEIVKALKIAHVPQKADLAQNLHKSNNQV